MVQLQSTDYITPSAHPAMQLTTGPCCNKYTTHSAGAADSAPLAMRLTAGPVLAAGVKNDYTTHTHTQCRFGTAPLAMRLTAGPVLAAGAWHDVAQHP
eukprot:166950-Pelagomonas_calceolata.AAC.1